MKKYLYIAAAAIAALSACTKEEIAAQKTETAEAPVFTATIEPETKTTLVGGTKVNWSNGDKININGKIYSTTSTTSTATFTAVDGGAVAYEGKYIAAYPSTVTVTPETSTLELPSWQYYDTNPNGIKSVPMVAVSTSTNLEFKNVCAVLAIKVASGTVKRILVKSDNKCMSGKFKLYSDTYRLRPLEGKNTVGLYCSKAVTANNTTFYIAIPAQEYSSLQIYIAADDENYKEVMATKAPAGLGTLERNKIFNITYQANAVQLWKDGPYFALENVGGTNEYRWGAEIPTESAGYNSGSYDKEHDTAYKVWGSAWRMPTQEEFEALISNSTITYSSNGTEGYIFTSTTSGYGSIFLPAQTSTLATQYWSSTADPDNSSNAYSLYLKKSSTISVPIKTTITSEQKSYSRGGTLPVRAVIATPAAAPDPNLIQGKFSVSDTKKVQFTKGNLYCNVTVGIEGNHYTYTFNNYAFENHQYDYPTGKYDGQHIGHFYWTTTRENSYSVGGSFGAQESTDKLWARNLTVNGTKNLNVLTHDEWTYLLDTRTVNGGKGEGYSWKKAVTVAGKTNCLIIAPDGYTGTIATEYTADEWETAEEAGLVCLPASGYRYGQNISDGGVIGNYYSSSTRNSYSYYLYFKSDVVNTDGSATRTYGYALRLVKTVE